MLKIPKDFKELGFLSILIYGVLISVGRSHRPVVSDALVVSEHRHSFGRIQAIVLFVSGQFQ